MIVCTGPVSNGTRLLTDIVRAIVEGRDDVEHRSMPQWSDFWDYRDDPEGTTYVIIVRRPDIAVRSAHRQGHGNPDLPGQEGLDHRLTESELMEWWERAMRRLAHIPGAYWLSYEALVAAPRQQIEALAGWLMEQPLRDGRVPASLDVATIRDENAKWL